MPSARKILILSLSRPKTGRSRSSTTTPSSRYLSLLIRFLRFLGFKITTVSQALEAPFGRFACLTFDGLAQATKCAATLEKKGVPATVFVVTRGGPSLKSLPPLAQAGWEVGAMGHELVDLTTQGYDQQRRLVSRSRSLIAGKVGSAPRLFAYPFGAYDATTVSCVRSEGFQAALTLRGGLNNGSVDAFHLRRLPLRASILADLFLILRTTVSRIAPPAARPEARDTARSGAAL